ncbi:MAG TPA: L,D-transpeptidase family protein [Candidatus Krumholzibacteria bacterium]|nr:L,D-transpeptidase family protein [Candidatus Krumholzibacteria bacterium]
MMVRAIGLGLAGIAALGLALVLVGTGYQEHALQAAPAAPATPERARVERALADRVPKGPYIVIDQARNRLEVRRGGEVVIEAVCSSGSGMVLREEGGQGRQWVFDTPRGQYAVKSKLKNPVWRKPDWAFIEEGVEPPADPGDRIEYGALGEYALYFGNGYMIHGTLYERLLGRSVTHGCIRLGRDNLAAVYRLCPVGTPIYIF